MIFENYIQSSKIIPTLPLIKDIKDGLPDDYIVSSEDIQFYSFCNQFYDGKLAKEAVTKALESDGCPLHIDPYELIIDSGLMEQ